MERRQRLPRRAGGAAAAGRQRGGRRDAVAHGGADHQRGQEKNTLDLSLESKAALVTGGSRGIGRGIAETLEAFGRIDILVNNAGTTGEGGLFMGMRLVKKSINQDAPDTYHLFYADGAGTPGTDLTFFPWPDLPRARPGAGQIVAVPFAVPTGSLGYWQKRFEARGVSFDAVETRFGELDLDVKIWPLPVEVPDPV